jgi:hypothetical protein
VAWIFLVLLTAILVVFFTFAVAAFSGFLSFASAACGSSKVVTDKPNNIPMLQRRIGLVKTAEAIFPYLRINKIDVGKNTTLP